MSLIRSQRGSFKLLMSLGLVLFAVFLSGCEILATQGARDAIANGREVRALEDRELAPLEQEMNDIWVNEIQPRESQLEDLRHKQRIFEEEVLRPLREHQNDAWAPGGEASEAQLVFDARYRELELLQRTVDIEQRELDTNWQNLWVTGADGDSEFQALEDLRYETQRELDRLYRFGYRPIDDIWDEINVLNSAQNWGNTDSQIESEEINIELRRLYDLYEEVQNGGNTESVQLEDKARAMQEQLNALYNHGWNPINEIYNEIKRLESERTTSSSAVGDPESVLAQIAELENQKATYLAYRDAEVASLKETLAASETDSSTPTTDEASAARIVELEQLIADLQVQAAELVASAQAESDSLNAQVAEIVASYEALIVDAQTESEAISAPLLADAAALDVQIAELTEAAAEGWADQVADLQTQKDALIAQEATVESALHDTIAQLESDRDAAIVELKSAAEPVDGSINQGLIDEIDTQIADYNAELDSLRANADGTTVLISNTTSSADILANIEAVENHWNGLIGDVDGKIQSLQEQLNFTSSVDNQIDSRIHSLQLQAAELEAALNTQIANLEGTVNELYRQANNATSGDSGRLAEVQSQIDAMNSKLEAIWQRDSSNGLEILKRVQELEKQARALEEELEQKTRILEEELWDIDDRLSLFYRDHESDNKLMQAQFEAQMAVLQQRRSDLEEQRWVIDGEQRTAFDAIEAKIRAEDEEIRRIEKEQFTAIRSQVRDLELEIRGFRDRQREIEAAMNEARQLIDQKKRELEDKVFDALEEAAGINGLPEDPIPEVNDDTLPEIDEGVESPVGTTN